MRKDQRLRGKKSFAAFASIGVHSRWTFLFLLSTKTTSPPVCCLSLPAALPICPWECLNQSVPALSRSRGRSTGVYRERLPDREWTRIDTNKRNQSAFSDSIDYRGAGAATSTEPSALLEDDA